MRLKEPTSLREASLGAFFNYLISIIVSNARSKTDWNELRNYCIEWITFDIRQELLDIFQVRKPGLSSLYLDLLEVIGDRTITKIWMPTENSGGIPRGSDYLKLMLILTKYDISKLRELVIKVCMNNIIETDKLNVLIGRGMMTTYLIGRGGEYLRVLDVQGACTNELLMAIGKSCKHLNKLNITASWEVNDDGIKNLCVKNSRMFSLTQGKEEDIRRTFDMIMNLPEDGMNNCCFTINRIKIQGTNTSHISLTMLLKFMTNLKTFGGYIYNRSIGDTIISYRRKYPLEKELMMSQLWDAHLPPEKMDNLTRYLPHLDTLYTWMKFIVPPYTHFNNITKVTLDFDHKPYEHVFENYLAINGKMLKSITIKDQMNYIDLTVIAKSCPLLTNLNASVDIKIRKENRGLTSGFGCENIAMECLLMAHVHTYTANCILWIFTNCPVLKCLEFILFTRAWSGTQFISICDSHLRLLVSSHAVAFKSLEYLSISNVPTMFVDALTVPNIIPFLENFDKLRVFGDLATLLPFHNEFAQLYNYMIANNRDIYMFCGREFQPPLPDHLLELIYLPGYGGHPQIMRLLDFQLNP